MKKKKKNKPQGKKTPEKKKTKKSESDQESLSFSESSEFGSVTVLKTGTSLAALLLAQNSNGMTGPIY